MAPERQPSPVEQYFAQAALSLLGFCTKRYTRILQSGYELRSGGGSDKWEWPKTDLLPVQSRKRPRQAGKEDSAGTTGQKASTAAGDAMPDLPLSLVQLGSSALQPMVGVQQTSVPGTDGG